MLRFLLHNLISLRDGSAFDRLNLWLVYLRGDYRLLINILILRNLVRRSTHSEIRGLWTRLLEEILLRRLNYSLIVIILVGRRHLRLIETSIGGMRVLLRNWWLRLERSVRWMEWWAWIMNSCLLTLKSLILLSLKSLISSQV